MTSINGHSTNPSWFVETGFMDLERIEVLQGPQGTKFGRNSVQGVINLVTKRPTDEFEGYVNVEAGSFMKKVSNWCY